MNIIPVEIPDVYIIEPQIFKDSRGYFFETYNKKKLSNCIGENYNFIQDNESKSSYGTIRGLHYQKPPFNQAKLVRVVDGEVLDVIVDIRKDSPTFGKHLSILLNDTNKKQLLIPRGFAHGFIVLSATAIFQYKVDNVYDSSSERGIVYSDKFLNIDWQLPQIDHILSDKDKKLNEFDANLF